jgi:hypothetical protein
MPTTCLNSPIACVIVNVFLYTAEAAESDPTQCIFAQVVSKYISTPVFALQSVVDNHQVCPGCSCDNCTNQQEINEWAIRMVRMHKRRDGFLVLLYSRDQVSCVRLISRRHSLTVCRKLLYRVASSLAPTLKLTVRPKKLQYCQRQFN